VLISDLTGALVAAGLTDSAGKVELPVVPGSTVTAAALWTQTLDGQMRTRTGLVSLFDVPEVSELYIHLNANTGSYLSNPPTMEVNVTLASSLAGTEGIGGSIDILCNGSRSVSDDAQSNAFHGTIAVTDVEACSGAGEIEVWGFARGGWDYKSIFMNAGTTGDVTLTADNNQMQTSTLFVDGVPSGSERIHYDVSLSMTVDGGGMGTTDTRTSPTAQEILSVDLPSAAIDHAYTQAYVVISDTPAIEAWAFRYGASPEDELHWNVSEDLALLESVFIDLSVPNRPAVTWQMAETGSLGDYVLTGVGWGEEGAGSWDVFLPADRVGTLRLPVLPDTMTEFAPAPPESVYVPGIEHIDDLFMDDYVDFVTSPTVGQLNFNETIIQL
jgi:hypothetical protein